MLFCNFFVVYMVYCEGKDAEFQLPQSAEEASAFQCPFPNPELVGDIKSIRPPKLFNITMNG